MASRFVIFIKLFLYVFPFFIVVLPSSISTTFNLFILFFILKMSFLYLFHLFFVVATFYLKAGNVIAICLLWCFLLLFLYIVDCLSFTLQLSYSILQFQKPVSLFCWNFAFLCLSLLCTF